MKIIKCILIGFLFLLIFSCRAQEKIEMSPQFLFSSAYDEIEKKSYPIIVINNNSDSRPYVDYDICVLPTLNLPF